MKTMPFCSASVTASRRKSMDESRRSSSASESAMRASRTYGRKLRGGGGAYGLGARFSWSRTVHMPAHLQRPARQLHFPAPATTATAAKTVLQAEHNLTEIVAQRNARCFTTSNVYFEPGRESASCARACARTVFHGDVDRDVAVVQLAVAEKAAE